MMFIFLKGWVSLNVARKKPNFPQAVSPPFAENVATYFSQLRSPTRSCLFVSRDCNRGRN